MDIVDIVTVSGAGTGGIADGVDLVTEALRRQHTASVTAEGAAWLASASAFPRSVEALWSARPSTPSVLPCGTAFDVVNVPALFGRRVLEQLWAQGPGSGPVAVHRDRLLLFAVPGAARRLPALLRWEEWSAAVPPLLCHGAGDAVTVPPLYGPLPGEGRDGGDSRDGGDGGDGPAGSAGASRWVVAPDVRHPWLPTAEVLLWACVRAARRTGTSPAANPAANPARDHATNPSRGPAANPSQDPAASSR
ncbi:bifunctional DNA primase/polymerase [Actinacidiphila sp. DG2A-62]|uniref:bifunctional DNA primase/polymerase n=1 Tax=Actinacidiphila sp. DG2A-62 TaxID=3108821 RepID=UPI002DBF1DB7|nr:bifunctional DNA primase/polymerase [Actinacidiphila sp. DG2A-62]MEC3994364.1 bifunctional DNA primase/polymerase [Actinacidiphila sp. DG2A-62]